MKPFANFIHYLQNKPYRTRTQILWGVTAVVGLIVLSIWINNLKSNIRSLSGANLISLDTIPVSNPHYLNIQQYEIRDGKLFLYFSFQNDTDDILNFPKPADISLQTGEQTIQPVNILNRQNQPFIAKALSHTQNFGVLVFEIEASSGQVVFNNLFFERDPQKLFKEILDFDLKQLTKPQDVRN